MSSSLSSDTRATLDGILSQAVAENRVPGAYFAVTNADGELYSGGAGLRVLQEPSEGSINDESVYWICSMTKVVVTIAIIQLIEKGLINYDSRADTVVPELSNPLVLDDPLAYPYTYKPAQSPILVKHLLNHSSGIHYYSGRWKVSPDDLGAAYNGVAYEGDHSQKKFFELIRNGLPGIPLAFEPGTSWTYGWNCDILAIMVERLTSKTIHDYCKQYIFDPIGMPSTTFLLTEDTKKNLVELAYRRKDGQLERWNDQLRLIERDPSKAVGMLLGGIGIYTTLKDYLAFLRHLLLAKDGRATSPILSPSSVNALFTPSLPPSSTRKITEFTGWPDPQFGYGLCLANSDWPGRRKKGSGFWYGWAGTYYFLDPTTGIAVVYGTQVVPTVDSEVVKLWEQLERALYTGL